MQRDVLARNLRPTYVSSAASANDASSSVVAQGALLANKYRVERVLGQGGMGYVVEARHITLEERVALKFLLPEYAKHPEASTRFLREARAAVKIKSEHVARVSDVGTLDSGAPYMVMEFLDGADLAQTLQRTGVLQIDDALDFILQASEAIAEAHNHGIVHRDLKPANLFLAKRPDGSPLVKVLDFGISKVMGGTAEHGLTKTTTAMGSALYMSPEQMQETRGVDHRTDIYSMGIALFELLAGRQPFYAETLPQLCAEVLTGVPTPLSAYRPDIPQDLASRIERAYERDKNRRYQSISEFAIALSPFAPERSRASIERLARMGGLAQPARNENSSSGIRPPVVTTPIVVASTTPRVSSPGAMAITAASDELPLQAIEPMPPIPDLAPLSDLRIEPGSYRAPISTNAAAAFASATKPGRQNSTSNRPLILSAVAIGTVIVVSTIVLVSYLRSQAQLSPDEARVPGPVTNTSVQVVPVPSTTTTTVAPPVTTAAPDKPPVTNDVPDAGPVVDAGTPGGPIKLFGTLKTAPGPSAPPSSKPKDPNEYLRDR